MMAGEHRRRSLSPDGNTGVYFTPQQGDGRLVIRSTETGLRKEIPRGAFATITDDNRSSFFRFTLPSKTPGTP